MYTHENLRARELLPLNSDCHHDWEAFQSLKAGSYFSSVGSYDFRGFEEEQRVTPNFQNLIPRLP